MKHNIILIGFMGSGKTSVGEALAKRMSYSFCDTDRLLEKKAGDTISHIFDNHGEEYFRNMETELLRDMQYTLDNSVLSTGGGLPLREQNSKLLRELGYVIHLKASKETTLKRLQGDRTRPLLQGDDIVYKVDKLITARAPIYESAAHKIVITDDKTIDEIVAGIKEAYLAYLNS